MLQSSVRNAALTLLGIMLLTLCRVATAQGQGAPVTLAEDDTYYTLDNGIVTAKVAKATGNLRSLQYKGMEVLFQQQGKEGAFFSQNATGGTSIAAKVTIDPKSNNGDRAEVSVKGIARRDVQSDIDFRFSVGRGESGVYFYCYYDHLPEYPAVSFPESRWVTRLDEAFNWTPLDDKNMREVPADLNGHQYLFAESYFKHRAYGWASPAKQTGVWLINPSAEYIGGGATKNDFLTHRDNPPATPFAPCILLFWKASHFGNTSLAVGAGEKWTKVIGPMFLYCNNGPDANSMWNEAKAQASKETSKWPYTWVKGIDYANEGERTTVKGQLLVLSDPGKPGAKLPNLLVGLAHPPYAPPAVGGRGGGRGRGAAADAAPAAAGANVPAMGGEPILTGRGVEWQNDVKYYQFWANGQEDGTFTIPAVRPGKYMLHAIADGVLGEFARADITVEAGKPIDLGKLTWTPIREGKQVWEIGVPNRHAKEFASGEKYWDPDGPLNYPKLFPNDVNFIIGKSDISKDWYWEHVPHALDDTGRRNGNAGVTGDGRATPYNIRFDMPAAGKGKATLRLAICGTQGRTIDVSVNEKPAGQVALGGADIVITRHGAQGGWYEREVAFDAALLKQGANTITLTIPAGPVNNGVVYDYLRLEMDEAGRVTAAQ